MFLSSPQSPPLLSRVQKMNISLAAGALSSGRKLVVTLYVTPITIRFRSLSITILINHSFPPSFIPSLEVLMPHVLHRIAKSFGLVFSLRLSQSLKSLFWKVKQMIRAAAVENLETTGNFKISARTTVSTWWKRQSSKVHWAFQIYCVFANPLLTRPSPGNSCKRSSKFSMQWGM